MVLSTSACFRLDRTFPEKKKGILRTIQPDSHTVVSAVGSKADARAGCKQLWKRKQSINALGAPNLKLAPQAAEDLIKLSIMALESKRDRFRLP